MKRLLLAALLLTLVPRAEAAPAKASVGLLVVGNQRNAAVVKRENAIVASFQARRKAAKLTADELPILVYHVDVPAEKKYCEGRLGIRSSEVLYVGLARLAADRLPGEVLDGRGQVDGIAAASPYCDRALANLSKLQGGLGGGADPDVQFAKAAAAGDEAMRKRDYDVAASSYAEAAALQPKAWRARARQASALIALSRWDDALRAVDAALALAPKESLPHGLRGLALAGKGNMDAARNAIQDAISFAPMWAVPHAWLAQLALSQRNLELAAVEGVTAMGLDPKLALAHYVVGTVYVLTWKLQAAVGEMRSAATSEPEWTSPLDLMGWALILSGKFTEAEAAYQKMLTLEPHDTAAFLGLALSRHNAGDDAAALGWIEKALAISPRDATTVAVHAFILAGLGRADDAFKEAQKAIHLDIRNPNAWEALGDAQSARGKWAGAAEDYEKAEALLRGWPEPELYYKWARALDRAGQRTDAIAKAKKLIEQYPDSAWDARTRDLLKSWGAQ